MWWTSVRGAPTPQMVAHGRESNGELVFALQKQSINCDYDEHLTVAKIAALGCVPSDPRDDTSHSAAWCGSCSQLAGKSPQGTVHAKTIYSTVNLVRRSPPGPNIRHSTTR